MMYNNSFFKVKNCTVKRGKRTIINNISFNLNMGEITLLTGKNGSGKSTLLKAIAGLIPLVEGEILYNEKKISSIPSHIRLKKYVSLLLQGNQIFPELKVKEHLQIAVSDSKKKSSVFDKHHENNTLLFIRNILCGKDHQKAKLLSGGEKAILALGMVLLRPKPIMLFDEPFTGISTAILPIIIDEISSIVRTFNCALLIVEHDFDKLNTLTKNAIELRGI